MSPSRLFLFCLAALTLSTVACRGQTVSVCEVLQNLNLYNNKTISVRGIESTGEGVFLMGSDCHGDLVTKGFTWPNAIYVIYSHNPTKLHEVPFETDELNVKQVYDAVKKAGLRRGDKLLLTVTGVLETDDLENRVSERPWGWIGLGFGPDGLAPAQLVMQRLSDPVIDRPVSVPMTAAPSRR